MKKLVGLLFCSAFLLLLPTESEAFFVHPVKEAVEIDAKTQKKLDKAKRKEAKMEKRMEKLEKNQ